MVLLWIQRGPRLGPKAGASGVTLAVDKGLGCSPGSCCSPCPQSGVCSFSMWKTQEQVRKHGEVHSPSAWHLSCFLPVFLPFPLPNKPRPLSLCLKEMDWSSWVLMALASTFNAQALGPGLRAPLPTACLDTWASRLKLWEGCNGVACVRGPWGSHFLLQQLHRCFIQTKPVASSAGS